MIFNLVRTVLEVDNYLKFIRYPRVRMAVYAVISVLVGIFLSNSPNASDLPILTVAAILFGFTINAVVMLGNSSKHYLSSDMEHSDQLETYYKKSLHISIHTLGIGLITIVVVGVFQLFPDLNLYLLQTEILGEPLYVEVISAAAYTLTVYYFIIFSIVIASAAELVKMRV